MVKIQKKSGDKIIRKEAPGIVKPEKVKEPVFAIEEEKEIIWGKIGRTIVYLIWFLGPILVLPLTLNPAIENKYYIISILVFAGLAVFITKIFATGKLVLPKTILFPFLLLFLLTALLSGIFSISRITSFWGINFQPDTFLNLLVYSLAFFLTVAFLKKESHFKNTIYLLFTSSAILAAFSLLQFFRIYLLPWEFAKNPNFHLLGSPQALSVFLGFSLLALIGFLSSSKLNRQTKIALYFLGLLFLAPILLINNFWTWILIFVVTSFLLAKQASLGPKKVGTGPWLEILILILAIIFLLGGAKPLSSLVNMSFEIKPTQQATFEIAKQVLRFPRLLFGTGPGTFVYDYSLLRSSQLNETDFWSLRFSQGASSILTFALTLGILGFLAVLSLIIAFFIIGFRAIPKISQKKQSIESLAISSFTGTMFLFLSWFVYPANFTLFLLSFLTAGFFIGTLSLAGITGSREYSFVSFGKTVFLAFLVLILLLTASVVGVYFQTQKYIGAVYFGLAQEQLARDQNLDNYIQKLGRILNLDSRQDRYLRAISQAYFLEANQVLQKSNLNSDEQTVRFQNAFLASRDWSLQATRINPQEPLNWTQLALVYEGVALFIEGADEQAVLNYQKITALDPLNPQTGVNAARALVLGADRLQNQINLSGQEGTQSLSLQREEKLKRALEYLEKSIKLKNNYTPALFLNAQVYEKLGERKLAIEKTQEALSINPFDAGVLFQLGYLHYLDNNFSEAKRALEQAVSSSQNYSNARYFLGLIYDKEGQRAKAIEQFEKIEELNPDNLEIKTILSNLRADLPALGGILAPEEREKPPIEE